MCCSRNQNDSKSAKAREPSEIQIPQLLESINDLCSTSSFEYWDYVITESDIIHFLWLSLLCYDIIIIIIIVVVVTNDEIVMILVMIIIMIATYNNTQ